MSGDQVIGWLCVGLVLGILGYQLWQLAVLVRKAQLPPPAKPASPWRSMPGNRLELSDTGFFIDLVTRPGGFTHLLYSPEGALCAHGMNLTPLKQYAEQLARERAEFAPPAPVPHTFARK